MAAKVRIKCPYCNEVSNIHMGESVCPECKRQIDLPQSSCVYLYRQGSPYGIAGGFGIYINGNPFGYIGNKELLCIPLPYGTYNLHCAVGLSKKCRDMQITLTPEKPVDYAKVYIKPGFWTNSFVIEPVDPKLLEF